MKTLLKTLIGTTVAALCLAGCSPWSKDRCMHTNWYVLGKQKGSIGAVFDIDQTARLCKSHGVLVSRQAYHRGYIAGLNVFCTNKSALLYGQHGGHYLGQCQQLSWSRDQAFRRFWKKGLLSYCQSSVIRQLALQGKPFPTWCPEERHAVLNVAYDQGHGLRQQQRSMQAHVSYLNQRIKALGVQINELYRQGLSPTSPRVVALQSERTHLTNERYLVQEHQASTRSL